MKYTEKLGLKKPELPDGVSIEDFNHNSDVLENVVGGLSNEVESHLAEKAKYQTSSGSNAITINTGGNFEYSQGNWFKWIQASNNTGAVIINVDGKGAKALRNFDGTALIAGDLEANSPYEAFYSAGSDFFVLRPRGAKLDAIIAAIISKGGTVATPQKVAEIVAAINNVAQWTGIGLKKWATGTEPQLNVNTTRTISGLNFIPRYIIIGSASYVSVSATCPNTNKWVSIGEHVNHISTVPTRPTSGSFTIKAPEYNHLTTFKWIALE